MSAIRFAPALLAAALLLAAPAMAQRKATKKLDLAKSAALPSGQGAIVVAFKRNDAESRGKTAVAGFARYSPEAHELQLDSKTLADPKMTVWAEHRGYARMEEYELIVLPVSPGTYVLFGASAGPYGQVVDSYCLAAPMISVATGELVYFGDLTPHALDDPIHDWTTVSMAYSTDLERVRMALAAQPALQAALKPADIRNGATFTCGQQRIHAYHVPGAAMLDGVPPPPPVP